MRVAAALLMIAVVGCAPRTSHLRYRVGVEVPKTPEALSCKRECLALYGPCTNYRSGNLVVLPEAGKYSKLYGCPGLVSDCLLTCPGAAVAGHGPSLVEVQVPTERQPSPDEVTARLVFCRHHPADCSEDERFRAHWLCEKNPVPCDRTPVGGTESGTPASGDAATADVADSDFDWLDIAPSPTIHGPI